MKRKRFLLPILFLLCGATLGYSEDAEFEPQEFIEEYAENSSELECEDVSYEPQELIEECAENPSEFECEDVSYEPEELIEEYSENTSEFECEDVSYEPEELIEEYSENLTELEVEVTNHVTEEIDYAATFHEVEIPDEGSTCFEEEEECEFASPSPECTDVVPTKNETAILGLGLPESMILDSRLNLNEFFAEDSGVTTGPASEFFDYSEFGVEVKKAGLYRVSFYQGISSGSLPCDVAIVLKQGFGRDNVKRAQRIKLKRGDFTDIAFCKILYIEEGEKISLKMWPILGEATLIGEFHSSGFTIEALGH